MKTCKNCGDSFPSVAVRDGRKVWHHKRACCDKCVGSVRPGPKATPESHPQFKQCPTCDRRFAWTKNDVCSTCRVTILRHNRRRDALAYLGGCCVVCGVTDPDMLTFHHKVAAEKESCLAAAWEKWSWEKIVAELDKCEVRCHNHHLKLHAEERRQGRRYKRLVELSYI
jgi:hypothetical protein